MQNLIEENTLLCLTETQQKVDRMNVRSTIDKFVCMRSPRSKKGGGIMVLKKNSTQLEIKENYQLHEDCMALICGTKGLVFILIIVYFNSNDSNDRMGTIINQYLENKEDLPILLIGDFNAHTGQLGERINKNGKLLEEIIERNNLVMLNKTPECEGIITWEARGMKSAIDYALANRKMFNYYKSMTIDENKEIYDLSDHCLIKVDLEIGITKILDREEDIVRNCFTRERMERFREEVKGSLAGISEEEVNIERIDETLKSAAQNHLRKKIKRRNNKRNKRG